MRIPGLDGDRRTTAVTPEGEPVVATTPAATTVDTHAAYEKGREDARRESEAAAERERTRIREEQRARERTTRRRGGFPLISILVALLAILGAAFIYFAVTRGSTTEGGAALGNSLSSAAAPARDATGSAVERAGDALKSSGEKIKSP